MAPPGNFGGGSTGPHQLVQGIKGAQPGAPERPAARRPAAPHPGKDQKATESQGIALLPLVSSEESTIGKTSVCPWLANLPDRPPRPKLPTRNGIISSDLACAFCSQKRNSKNSVIRPQSMVSEVRPVAGASRHAVWPSNRPALLPMTFASRKSAAKNRAAKKKRP